MRQTAVTELYSAPPPLLARHPIKNGWVFSQRGDAVLFGIPFLVGWLIVLLNSTFHLETVTVLDRTAFVAAYSLVNFLDIGHVWSTVLTTYFKPATRAKHRFLLFVGPVIVLAINIAIYEAFGEKGVIYFFAYYNFYHVVRQQIGWVAISSRKAGENGKFDRWLDKLAIYGVMTLPFIWMHVAGLPNWRRFPFPSNVGVAQAMVVLFVGLFVVYAARQAQKWFSGEPTNFAKLFIVLATAVTWGGPIFTRSRFAPLVATIVHGTPYVGIIYLTDKHEGALRGKLEHYLRLLAPIAFGVLVIVAGLTWSRILRFFQHIVEGGRFVAWVTVVSMVIPIMHYAIDGVIWRRRTFNAARELA